MKNSKKTRALKSKNVEADVSHRSLGHADSDETMDGELLKHKVSTKRLSKQTPELNKSQMVKDFDVQAKLFVDNIDNVYVVKKKAIEYQYTKVFLKIQPDMLDLTLAEYMKLRGMPLKAAPTVVEPTEQLLQSPNVSSSQTRTTMKATRPSLCINLQGSFAALEKSSTGSSSTASTATIVTSPPAMSEPSNQLVLRKSMVGNQQRMDPRVVLTKFDPSKTVNPLRWPGYNELTMSLKGSPLAMPITSRISTINLNIPLLNGNVMAIFPRPLNQQMEMPALSDEVLQQLVCIEENIGIVKRMCQQQRLQQSTSSKQASTALTPRTRK